MFTHKIIKQIAKAIEISQCDFVKVIANDEKDIICETRHASKAVEAMLEIDSDFTVIFHKKGKSPFAWINPYESDFLIDCSESIEKAFF